MLHHAVVRRFTFSSAPFFLFTFSLAAQAPAPAQPSGPAPITMEEEHHHHLVLENAYVKAFYVEIPAHESTLYHRHDLPYVSFPPPPLPDAPQPSVAANVRPVPPGPRVGYAAAGFSHAVNNSSDVALRNVAIELVRPQGTVRNRCAEAVRGQPLNDCDKQPSSDPSIPSHYSLFETDEILVEYWDIGPGLTIKPADAHLSTLVGGMSGIVEVTAGGDSRAVPQAGLVWLLAGSEATLKAGPTGGQFVTIQFKDSARPLSQ